MGPHFLIVAGIVLLGFVTVAIPNPQFFISYYQQPSLPYYYQQPSAIPLDYQQLLGPYYRPIFGLNYPPAQGLVSSAFPSHDSRIVDGFHIPAGLIPFMAGYSLPNLEEIFSPCGGSLITSRHVLTAAHCVDSKDPLLIGMNVFINSLTLSLVDLPATAVVRKVQKIDLHEKYVLFPDKTVNEYDVAILTLDKDVTTVKPVQLANCLQTDAVEDKSTGFVAGWGLTDPTNTDSESKILLGTVLHVLSNTNCEKIRGNSLKRTQICAEYAPGGRDSCNGDSGGPLLVGNKKNGFIQVGVVSFGPTACGVKDVVPGVYARVSRFFDWINTKTGGLLVQ